MTEYISTVREGTFPEELERSEDWEECFEAIVEHAGAEPPNVPERPPEESEIWAWHRDEIQLSPVYTLYIVAE